MANKRTIIMIERTLATLLLFSLFSCATKPDVDAVIHKPSTEAKNFPTIKNVNAYLKCVSTKMTFFVDEDITLTFKFGNLSTQKLVIYEWMRQEDYNVKLYCFACKPGDKLPPASEWKLLEPKTQNPIMRQCLELAQGNSTFVNKTFRLNAIGLTNENLADKQLLYVVGSLNLKSLTLNSKVLKIEIKRR